MKPVARVTAPDLIAWAILIKHLAHGKLTNRELAEECGLAYLTVCRYTRALHQVGAAYICRYEIDSGGKPSIRVFKLGQDDDAEVPTRSRAIRQREQRFRAKLQRPLPFMGA